MFPSHANFNTSVSLVSRQIIIFKPCIFKAYCFNQKQFGGIANKLAKVKRDSMQKEWKCERETNTYILMTELNAIVSFAWDGWNSSVVRLGYLIGGSFDHTQFMLWTQTVGGFSLTPTLMRREAVSPLGLYITGLVSPTLLFSPFSPGYC